MNSNTNINTNINTGNTRKSSYNISKAEFIGGILPVLNCFIVFMQTVDGPNQHFATYQSIHNVHSYHYNSTNSYSAGSPKYEWLPTTQVYYLCLLLINYC